MNKQMAFFIVFFSVFTTHAFPQYRGLYITDHYSRLNTNCRPPLLSPIETIFYDQREFDIENRCAALNAIIIGKKDYLQSQLMNYCRQKLFVGSGSFSVNSSSVLADTIKKTKPHLWGKKDSLPLVKRFLYAQTVFTTLTLMGYVYIIVDPRNKVSISEKVSRTTLKESFTMLPKINDHDSWQWNYVAHPVMGQISYLAYRNRGGSRWGSFCCTLFSSTFHEYIIASSTQRPSVVDLTITPIAGSMLGECSYQVRKMIKKKYPDSFFGKAFRIILDPVESLRNMFN
jgi:hypothetical protein